LILYKPKVCEIVIIACILSNFFIFKDELRKIGAIKKQSKGKHFRKNFCEHTHTKIMMNACIALFS